MSSSCDTAPAGRVLRGVAATRAARHELPNDLPGAGRAEDAAGAAEQGRRAGFDAGYAEGLLAAERQADADRAVVVAEAAALLHGLARASRSLEARTTAELGRVEDAIVTAAFELAEAILGRAATEPAAGRDAVARALSLAPRNAAVTLFLHPEDLALLDRAELPEGVTLAADASLERGGCVAEAGDCTVDARLSGALDRAREALR